ncbi:unnamed protein product, partial [marine sediment metagenome]
MGRRYKIGKSYVERSRDGTFKKWTKIGKSLARDRVVKAKTKVKAAT